MNIGSENNDLCASHKKTQIKRPSKGRRRSYDQRNFPYHDAVLKALRIPLEQAGIVLVPTIIEVDQDDNSTVIKMTIAFVNTRDSNDRVMAHYIGQSVEQRDTLTLILEF